MSMKPYTLSSEQVEAIYDLLLNISFEKLQWRGEVVPIGRIDSFDTPEIIKALFYDEQFGIQQVDTESE